MIDQESPFSYNIRQAFLDYIIEHNKPSSEICSTDEDMITEILANGE